MIVQPNHNYTAHRADIEAPFDEIAYDYVNDTDKRIDRTHILIPSAQHYCGDLKGKTVMDLGCGSGYFSRLLKGWGAKSVLSLDLSPKMVELANQYDSQKLHRGITYQVGNVSNLDFLGEFDLIFAAFLLHYAPTIEVLQEMCNSVASNLRPGGRFVTFNENPSFPIHDGMKYDVCVSSDGPISNGVRIKRTHYREGKPLFSFSHYHWEKDVYEQTLQQAGFTNVNWMTFIKSKDAEYHSPPNYWDDYTSQFSISVLICEKILY